MDTPLVNKPLEAVLKPKHVEKPRKNARCNYVTDIMTR
jgi:hypothetical protein